MLKLFLGLMMISITNVAAADCSGLYNHQFTTLQGKSFNLCDYQNKPILVVNTASKCGFTPQFEDLEAMYKKHKPDLLVIGFPSNDFRQELSSNKEIGDFCVNTYKVQFPMMSKTAVTGQSAHPFYQELTKATHQAPMWNFYKYLILPGGKEVYAFSSDVKASDPEIMRKIKPYLN